MLNSPISHTFRSFLCSESLRIQRGYSVGIFRRKKADRGTWSELANRQGIKVSKKIELADRNISEQKRFDESQHSKVIKKHFELLEKRRIAPASKQTSIAGESVSLASGFALA